jgi:protease-4
METLGVEMQTIRSSDIKGGLSPFRQATVAEVAANQAMIEEAYEWFRGLVGERRGMDDNTLDKLANGGVYSGRQAVDNGLIDALGDERNAVAYLESLDADLVDVGVETWHEAVESRGLLGYVGAKLGINPLLEQITGKTGPRLYSLKR